jgi:tetratricopeptide (TPR) repeat protein
VLRRQKNTDAAVAAFELAISAAQPDDELASLWIRLARLYESRSEFDRAAAAYRAGIDASADAPKMRAVAGSQLGDMLRERGDTQGAKAGYQIAVDAAEPELSPKAAGDLGSLLRGNGDYLGAKRAFQIVIDSADPELTPGAWVQMGLVLHELGDIGGARAAYQIAATSGNALMELFAKENLRRLG